MEKRTYVFDDGPAVVRMEVTLTRSAMVKFGVGEEK
jgi:hypothetical protein